MRVSLTWAALGALFVGSLLTGCTASFQLGDKDKPVKAPPPVPSAPVDTDGDSIPDRDDKCPAEKEDNKPPVTNDGCPTTDGDGDGVDGDKDKCPDQKGTVANNGCPEEKKEPPKPKAKVTETAVEIDDTIRFEKGKAEIKPESIEIIKDVAQVLKEHPEIQLAEVAGHASKDRPDEDAAYNKRLSQERVDAVVAKLVELGVEKERLAAHGYGFYCPKDPATTPEAIAKNRRVEFLILHKGGKVIAKTIGCPAAVKAGIKFTVPPYKKPVAPKPATPAKPTTPATTTTPAPTASGTTTAPAPTTAPTGTTAPTPTTAPANAPKAPAKPH